MTEFDDLNDLPWSELSEQEVLGALLISGKSFPLVADWLEDSDFFRRDHRLTYQAIRAQAEVGKAYDVVTITDWFHGNGLLESVDNGAYLLELTKTQASAANIVAHAEIVKDKARLRAGIEIGTKLINACRRPRGREVATIVSQATAALSALQGDPRAGGLVPYSTLLTPWFDDFVERHNTGDLPGLPLPWDELNDVLNGLQDGELVVLGAASNAGKSVAAFQLARNLGRKHHGAVFSMEQTGSQIVRRDVAGEGRVPYQWLQRPKQDDPDCDLFVGRIQSAIGQLRQVSYVVDTQARLTTIQISARARRAHMQKALRWVIVDHLHEITLPGKQKEDIERGDAVRDLKALAKELQCPVVALAQLNRTGREGGKRPTMTALRGSGGIEEAADVVIFLHRPDAYDANDRPGLVECIVGKGRDVKTGQVVNLRSRYDEMRIEPWGDEPVPRAAVSKTSADQHWGQVRKSRAVGSKAQRSGGDHD